MKKNLVINAKSQKDIEKAIAVLKAMGITIESESAKAETTKEAPKAEKKSSKKTSDKVDWAKLEPKKDEDGYYNWNSWKKCRDKYLKLVGKDFDTVGKVEYEEFQKNVAPFAKKYAYVKKTDRK